MYLYSEASDGDEGDIAILVSPHIDISTATQPVLSFWWHMLGDDFDEGATAHVDIWDGSAWVEIWTMTGNQGDVWNQEFIDITGYTDGLVRFSINKVGYAQDWAIDDFGIEEYTTPVSDFAADPLTAYTSSTIQLTDKSTMLPTSWSWTITGPGTVTYENGTDSTSQNPAFSADTAGSYTVELTATNTLGAGTTETKTDYITLFDPPTPITFPESFEGDGTWTGLTTGNSIIPNDPGNVLTFNNTSAYDGTYSIHFLGPQNGDDVASITFGMNAITGESLSFYFDAIDGSGANGYSEIFIYEVVGGSDIEIDSFDMNDYTGQGWTQWSSPAYTADEPKVYKIEFAQSSGIADMEVYVDFLDQGVITLD
jgi:PKD repeat protein